MAKPNYAFEKRQRDLEKKRKQEEKRLRKTVEKSDSDASNSDDPAQGLKTEEGTPDTAGQ